MNGYNAACTSSLAFLTPNVKVISLEQNVLRKRLEKSRGLVPRRIVGDQGGELVFLLQSYLKIEALCMCYSAQSSKVVNAKFQTLFLIRNNFIRRSGPISMNVVFTSVSAIEARFGCSRNTECSIPTGGESLLSCVSIRQPRGRNWRRGFELTVWPEPHTTIFCRKWRTCTTSCRSPETTCVRFRKGLPRRRWVSTRALLLSLSLWCALKGCT